MITVDLVYRALRDRGQQARFIYSWDDYDVFRRVPDNLPQAELLQQYLRQPLTRVPDTAGAAGSYAAAREDEVERVLPLLGIRPEYRYQAERYQRCDYAEQIKIVLAKRAEIRELLNQFRQQELPVDWWPLAIFCRHCHRDSTVVKGWDGDQLVDYHCADCGKDFQLNLNYDPGAKLPWRLDWPMRWSYEQVDFEPAGKEHHSAGGSFSTAKLISRQIFNFPEPATLKYDFIILKGAGGKMSSSSGKLLSLADVLRIYQPEVIRYLFAGARPNSEFAISFDLDVLKIYDEYDRLAELYYQTEAVNASRKQLKMRRVFELAQVGELGKQPPYSVSFRHLCNLLQIQNGCIETTVSRLEGLTADQRDWVLQRAFCAKNWLAEYAPQDFLFRLRCCTDPQLQFTEQQQNWLRKFAQLVRGVTDQKMLSALIYDYLRESGTTAAESFPLVYRSLINRDQGPRLVAFLGEIGTEKAAELILSAIEE